MSRPHSNGLGVAFDARALLANQIRKRRTEANFWADVNREGPVVVSSRIRALVASKVAA